MIEIVALLLETAGSIPKWKTILSHEFKTWNKKRKTTNKPNSKRKLNKQTSSWYSLSRKPIGICTKWYWRINISNAVDYNHNKCSLVFQIVFRDRIHKQYINSQFKSVCFPKRTATLHNEFRCRLHTIYSFQSHNDHNHLRFSPINAMRFEIILWL